jgi:hypothetical protein
VRRACPLWTRASLTLICLVALSACAGNGSPAGGGSSSDGSGADFGAIQRDIFNVNCLGAGCHNATDRGAQSNLVLDAIHSYDALVNVSSTNPVAKSAGLRRVVPGSPDQSFLMIKLTNPAAGEGGRMPLGAAALSPASIEHIRAWILAGAPRSSVPTATASATSSATQTDTPTALPTDSPTAAATVTPTISPTGTLQATATPTATEPPTLTPTLTSTASATPTATMISTPTFSLEATFPQIQATIFDTTCLGSGCHNAADASGGLVLEAGRAYGDLVGAAPQNAAALAAGMRRVDSGIPENSFLITKLTLPGAFDQRFMSRMPLGQPSPLPTPQIEAIRAWILRGALAEETPP